VPGFISRRWNILRTKLEPPRGDVLAGEFVQCLWGGPVGFLRSVEKNGVGLVLWLRHPGRYEIIDTKLLRRAPEKER
jgi:hypothetical protein